MYITSSLHTSHHLRKKVFRVRPCGTHTHTCKFITHHIIIYIASSLHTSHHLYITTVEGDDKMICPCKCPAFQEVHKRQNARIPKVQHRCIPPLSMHTHTHIHTKTQTHKTQTHVCLQEKREPSSLQKSATPGRLTTKKIKNKNKKDLSSWQNSAATERLTTNNTKNKIK